MRARRRTRTRWWIGFLPLLVGTVVVLAGWTQLRPPSEPLVSPSPTITAEATIVAFVEATTPPTPVPPTPTALPTATLVPVPTATSTLPPPTATTVPEPTPTPPEPTPTEPPATATPAPRVAPALVATAVVAPAPPAPARPVVPVSADVPRRIRIPRLRIDTIVEQVGLTADGAMDVPKRYDTVGWYKLGARPGEIGSAVIAGHLDSKTGPAIFWRLRDLRAGDEIYISNGSQAEIRFVVDESVSYPFNDAPLDRIFGANSRAGLNLITCSGSFDRGSQNYDKRLVVYATMA